MLLNSCFKQYRRRDFWRVGGCCAVVVLWWSLVGLVGWLGCMQLAVSRVRVGLSLGLGLVGSFSCDLGTFCGSGWVVGRVGWFRAIVGRLCASCATFAGWVGWWFGWGGRGRQASRVVVCGVGARSSVIVTASRVVGRRGWVGTLPDERRGRGIVPASSCGANTPFSKKRKTKKMLKAEKRKKRKTKKSILRRFKGIKILWWYSCSFSG